MDIALVSGAVVVCLTVYILRQKHVISFRGQVKLYMLGIYVIALLLWPVFWEYMLQDYAFTKASIPSLHWPIFIILLEIYLLKYHKLENETRSKRGILSMDANILCTLTFALSSILSSHSDEKCRNLFLYGVLGCIAFVMPNPNAPSETLENIIIESIQKMCLIYSTGLLLAGVILIHNKAQNVTT
jgi:hypothetical protein